MRIKIKSRISKTVNLTDSNKKKKALSGFGLES